MLNPQLPALVLAPMDGITDASMRTFQGAAGAFTYAVSEFIRVSADPIPAKVFWRDVPELLTNGITSTGLPVQVQILGGDAERMAISAATACQAGAKGIDINFGCPAPTVNRHDGGASLLKTPCRIRDIVAAVRQAVPCEIPVSAKLRLGWESIDEVYENADMAAQGGASWLTVHARTRVQGYAPPVYWSPIRRVRESLGIPVIANGDIWTFEDFLQCRDESGSAHFMIGRGALADPTLAHRIATELDIAQPTDLAYDWVAQFQALVEIMLFQDPNSAKGCLLRLKQWTKLAARHGQFPHFDALKTTLSLTEFFDVLVQKTSFDAPIDSRRIPSGLST